MCSEQILLAEGVTYRVATNFVCFLLLSLQIPPPLLALLCGSVAKSCLTICDLMNCSTPGLPLSHYLPEFAQVHVHWVGDAIQPAHTLPLSSPLAFNLPQHQCLFQWVGCSHQVAKVLELQHQSYWRVLIKHGPLEEKMANHSSILAPRTPWTV